MTDLENRNVGKAVTVAGYTFRNSAQVKAWAALTNDPELFRFAWDFKVQVIKALDSASNIGEVMSNRAAAIKAGFTHYKSAFIMSTFELVYPEGIFRTSTAAKDAHQGGLVFRAAFSAFKIFEGDAKHSTLCTLKDNLNTNYEAHQAT